MKPSLLLIILIVGCKTKNKSFIENKQSISDTPAVAEAAIARPFSYPFFDNISGKLELTKEQIRKNTIIDSVYYSKYFPGAIFSGDTIFKSANNNIIGVIKFDDKMNCTLKFLLVFNSESKTNSHVMTVYKNCDFDLSSNNEMLEYEFITSSSFKTILSFFPVNFENDSTKISKRATEWKINNIGSADSIPHL